MPTELIKPTKENLETLPKIPHDGTTWGIQSEDFHVFSGRATVCCLTLKNGHMVTGYTVVSGKEHFNEKLGRKIAYDKAWSKIIELQTYAEHQRVYEEATEY